MSSLTEIQLETRVRISIIGHGAVGRTLARVFRANGDTIAGIADLEPGTAPEVEHTTATLPLDVDLVALTVPDRAIKTVAHELANRMQAKAAYHPENASRVVMHTSGLHGLTPLEALRYEGWVRLAWHPVTTFSRDPSRPAPEGFVAGVAMDDGDGLTLKRLKRLFQCEIWEVAEEDRIRYHRAAVFASNFLPPLFEAGVRDLNGIASPDKAAEGLGPLVRAMVGKLVAGMGVDAASGPVVRGDFETVEAHLEDLPGGSDRDMYITMTRALVSLLHREERIDGALAAQWHKFLHDKGVKD
jgi:predicted short-subunit dehydrogenase-like oxidoreductase (DUF2520 family)